MRAFAVFRKSLREQLRDWWALGLSVTTAAFFVLLYWSITGGGSTTYSLIVIDRDQPVTLADGTELAAGRDAVEALRSVEYATGDPMLHVEQLDDRAEAERQLRDRDAMALMILPEGLSAALAGLPPQGPVDLVLVGDLSHPFYPVAAVFASSTVQAYVAEVTGTASPLGFEEIALGDSGGRTEFEAYVPGLLIVAIVMVLFTAAMSVAREVEGGTLRRLQLTRMTSFDFLAGVSAVQVLVAVAGLLFTFGVAWALGFRSEGPLWAAILVGAATSLAVIGVGLVVACFARTVTRAFLVANLPFILLMFFSGSIFPMGKVALFEVAGHTVGLWDILPPTHAVVALNKILSLGAGFGDVLWELGWLLGLSAIYFGAGVWLFRRTHLRPRR
jgi:ABC-2 type transport system permease protein